MKKYFKNFKGYMQDKIVQKRCNCESEFSSLSSCRTECILRLRLSREHGLIQLYNSADVPAYFSQKLKNKKHI